MPEETEFASVPELAIYDALIRLGWDGKFIYQYPISGGHAALGGAVIDFYIPELNLGIEIMGEYYHYEKSNQQVMRDIMKRTMAEGQGITLVYIDESDALEDPLGHTEDAIKGISHSRMVTA